MKPFLHKIVLFSLPFILISLLSLFFIQHIQKPYILDEDIKTIITGDSHIQCAINDSLLDNNIRNLSLVSEGFIFSYYKLKSIIENNPNISSIWLGVGYHNLSSYYDNIDESILGRYYSLIDPNSIINIIKAKPSLVFVVFKAYKYVIMTPYIGHFQRINGIFNEESMWKRIKAQYGEENDPTQPSELNLLYLDKIVFMCEEKGINLVFINTPLHQSYLQNIPANYIELYNQIINSYQLAVIDFEGITFENDCFFRDGDHLNYKGAMIASNWIKANYKSISTQYTN